MAPRPQPNLAADERTEREFALDVNTAVANTEGEIAAFAFGEEEPDNDADTSLEQMGDGLEGGDLEDDAEDESETGDEQLDDETLAAGDEEAEDDELDDQQPQRQQQDDRQPRRGERQDDERQQQRGVPPGRHREVAQRARTAEQGLETEREARQRLERELAETRGQIQLLSQQVAQPRQQQQVEQRA